MLCNAGYGFDAEGACVLMTTTPIPKYCASNGDNLSDCSYCYSMTVGNDSFRTYLSFGRCCLEN